ncbi:MAG: family 16 glycoside hydrolase [Planctomycetota bacterium]
MKTITLFAFVLVLSMLLVSTSLPAEPYETAGWVGTNYTPAYCASAVELWHDFRPEVIEKELAAAKGHFGITTLRVYLHNIPHSAEKEEFLQRIDQFLAICRRHGIRPGFTFFDDCWNHEGVSLESLPPVKGRHNGRWAACPQDVERTDEHLPELKAYVQDVVRPHRDDPRVLWWEIFNEPNLKSQFSVRLRTLAYGWAKELEPIQPVISCWDDSPETDVVDAHNYSNDFAQWDRQAELNPEKGAVFTEAGARWYAPRPSSGEPIEVIHWLQRRKAAEKYVPGVYLCWELMVGNSHCRWYWGTEDAAPEPTIPWCGLLWPDGTPVSLAEAEAIRHYTTGQERALFFDDFQLQDTPRVPDHPGWKAYGSLAPGGSGVLKVEPGMKMIAGDTGWTDYVVEAVVMLKEGDGNAGLVFRVNDPGPRHDQMRGYYVGLDTEKLYLGKMNNNWEPLATYDLGQLECKVVPGVWNLIRVAVEGPRIRVWLNRMHHDDGLRIDHTDRTDRTDQSAPILSGAVGVRAHHVSAWFDNVVVLPIEALPEAVTR